VSPGAEDGPRLSEIVAALSLACDLGMGQPMEHSLRTSLLSASFGEALGLASPILDEVRQVAERGLLLHQVVRRR